MSGIAVDEVRRARAALITSDMGQAAYAVFGKSVERALSELIGLLAGANARAEAAELRLAYVQAQLAEVETKMAHQKAFHAVELAAREVGRLRKQLRDAGLKVPGEEDE